MDEKTRLLICIGSSVATSCLPCLVHYHAAAREAGCSDEEMREAFELGGKVRNGANVLLRNLMNELSEGKADGEESSGCASGDDPCCC